MLFKKIKHIIASPRLWLSASLTCFGAAALVGYHQDQMAATTVLAEKIGMPSEVLIQDFDPQSHTNIIDELQILAEVDLASASAANVGSESNPFWLIVVPLYQVSTEALPLARQHLVASRQTVRRPVSRQSAEELSAEESLALLADEPKGVIVSEVIDGVTTVSAERLGLDVIGQGKNGTLVRFAGVALGGGTLIDAAAASLKERGIELVRDALMVSPQLPDDTGFDLVWLKKSLIWGSILMASMATILRSPIKWQSLRKAPEPVEEVQAVRSFPVVFQPIRTQAEIAREQQQQAEATASPARRVISRLVT